MSCSHCSPTTKSLTENPFKDFQSIVKEPADRGILLASCTHCGQIALHYWVYTYDILLQHWCPIDEDEQTMFMTLREQENKEQAFDAAISIIREHKVLTSHAFGGLDWIEGKDCTVGGLPSWEW
jgi:hypothetical protein